MTQIIDIKIPTHIKPTVRDALQYVLRQSGYSLCDEHNGDSSLFSKRPLPIVQYSLGPMSLGDALQVLGGPAWQVKVDEVNRQICFDLRQKYRVQTAFEALTKHVETE